MTYIKAWLIIALFMTLNGCNQNNTPRQENVSDKSTKELIDLLKDQNDPNNLFGAVTKELARRGPSASDAAPALAVALTYTPKLASLLWYPDSESRSAAAMSIDAIVGINLVDPEAKIDLKTPGALAKDEPDGIVSGKAREWWKNTGQYMNWPTESCKTQ
jgi:hypothetical protein